MQTSPIERRIIRFPQGTQAHVLLATPGTAPDLLLSALALPTPHAVILLAGGAGKMKAHSYQRLHSLFAGFAVFAAQIDALIIDGGTQAGVMALIGEGVATQTRKPILLGVAPEGRVSYPGKPATNAHNDTGPLDPNHSHFVLVHTQNWGGETATMYELARAFSHHCPSIALLVNGGSIAKNEILLNVRQHRPIIIVEGSGRLADEIAQAWRKRPAIPADAQLAEIIMHGNLHLFLLTDSLQQLEFLFHRLLQG